MSHVPVFIQEIIKTSNDMWQKGWAEANGGNISLRLKPETIGESIKFSPSDWIELGIELPDLAHEKLLVTGTGKYLRNISILPEKNIGVIEMDKLGSKYRMLWGFAADGRPTSELKAHLRSHAVIKIVSKDVKRAVIHTHAPHLIALSYALDLNTLGLTKLLWQCHAECIVGFPSGIEFIPWMMAGSDEIATATAKALQKRPMALWPYHGIFGTGRNLDEAFGLIDMAEKAAQIYLMAVSSGTGISGKLSSEQLRAIAANFKVCHDEAALAYDNATYFPTRR